MTINKTTEQALFIGSQWRAADEGQTLEEFQEIKYLRA
jgi:hypothetical protein